VKGVRAVGVDEDSGRRVRVGVAVAADMAGFVDDEDAAAALLRLVRERGPEEAGSDDKEVVHDGACPQMHARDSSF
jgi:hypothetical protein